MRCGYPEERKNEVPTLSQGKPVCHKEYGTLMGSLTALRILSLSWNENRTTSSRENKKRMTCKNKCTAEEYNPKKTVRDIKNTLYKRCNGCEICITYQGVFCPCCNMRLSTRQKSRKARGGGY